MGGQNPTGKAKKDDFAVICSQILKASFRKGADIFFFLIEIQLIYNVVLVSAVQ